MIMLKNRHLSIIMLILVHICSVSYVCSTPVMMLRVRVTTRPCSKSNRMTEVSGVASLEREREECSLP